MQQAITDRDNKIQAIQYENVDLQCELRNARQTVEDLIENRYDPPSDKYDNVFCVFEKKKGSFNTQRNCYLNSIEKGVCDNAKGIHA